MENRSTKNAVSCLIRTYRHRRMCELFNLVGCCSRTETFTSYEIQTPFSLAINKYVPTNDDYGEMKIHSMCTRLAHTRVSSASPTNWWHLTQQCPAMLKCVDKKFTWKTTKRVDIAVLPVKDTLFLTRPRSLHSFWLRCTLSLGFVRKASNRWHVRCTSLFI